MRSFLLGFAGALTCLVIVAIVAPLYSDYRAAAETSRWLGAVAPLQGRIETVALRQQALTGIAQKIGRPVPSLPGVRFVEVRDGGEILIQGGRQGQMIVLLPVLADGRVSWRCVGGSTKDVLAACRGSTQPAVAENKGAPA